MNEKLLEQIIHNAPNYIFWKDTSLVYRGCNCNFAHIAGLDKPEQIVGMRDNDMPWQSTGHLYQAEDQEILLTGQAILNKEVPMVLEAETRMLSVSKVPLYGDNKKITGVLGIYIDITQQATLIAELKKSLQVKTEFLENMRHDIRTPLTGIVGFAEIIKNEVTDPKIKEYVDNLAASSYALLDLLNGVLEAISVSSGEIPLLQKKFNLQNKLNSVILLNQARARQKNLELSFEYDSTIPNYLMGDSTRLHRIALELIANALNFTNKGYVQLSVHLAKDTENDVIIKMVVEDTGVGIEPEKQQDIYVQFKRLTPSYEGIYKGVGLGLSIVKQFVDDLQGELYLESQVGVGSKFTVIIKLRKSLLDEPLGSEDLISLDNKNVSIAEVQPLVKNNIPEPVKNSRILVVEDNVVAARVVVGMLSGMDCQVDVADKGKLAVQMAEESQYDLIFMDIGLPDIDGYEVTKRIRLGELNKSHVPIIALTAHMDEDNKQHCIGIGMNAVLTKPLGKEKAEDILNSFIPYRKEKLKLAIVDAVEEGAIATEIPVFNFELVKEQFGSEKVALEMVTMFLESLPSEVEQLQAVYGEKDWIAVQNLTHRLKGGVSYCGAMRLDQACLKLECAIKDGQNALWENLYQQLLNEILLVEMAIKDKIH